MKSITKSAITISPLPICQPALHAAPIGAGAVQGTREITLPIRPELVCKPCDSRVDHWRHNEWKEQDWVHHDWTTENHRFIDVEQRWYYA